MEYIDRKMIPEDYKQMLIDMSEDLDGTLSFHDCYDSNGIAYEKVVLEYGHKKIKTE